MRPEDRANLVDLQRQIGNAAALAGVLAVAIMDRGAEGDALHALASYLEHLETDLALIVERPN